MIRRIALLLAVLLAVPLGSLAQTDEHEPFTTSLKECIAAERQVSVVFLIDESGSLRETDPDGARAVAALGALGMFELMADPEAGNPIEVDVSISAFASEFTPGPFREITESNKRAIVDDLESVVDRSDAQDTDYVSALLGGLDLLEGRPGCRLLLWFTDGRYSIHSNTQIREPYESRLGGPVSGDRATVYEEIGRSWLCEDNDAIADRLRAAEIYLLTGALDLEPRSEALFTQRITEGIDDDGQTCGVRWGEAAATRGAFVNADTTEDLIFALIPGSEPQTGDHDFVLVRGMTRVFIMVATPGEEYQIALVPPGGEDQARSIPYGSGAFVLSGAEIRPEWYGPQAYALTLRLDPADRSWAGDWVLRFSPDDEGKSKIVFFGDLSITPAEAQVAGVIGEDVEVAFRAVDFAGGAPEFDDLEHLEPTAVVVYEDSEEVVAGVWTDDGVFTVGVPGGSGSATVHPTVSILVPGTDERIPIDGASAVVTFAPRPTTTTSTTTTTTLPPPPGAPTAGPDRVVFPTLTTPGRAIAESAVSVSGSDGRGCVFVEDVAILEAPPGAGDVTLEVLDGGTQVWSSGECSDLWSEVGPGRVDTDGEVSLDLAARVPGEAIGEIEGTIDLVLTTEEGGAVTERQIRFTIPLDREHDAGVLWLWFLLLAGLGLAAPLSVAGLTAGRLAKPVFQPAPARLGVGSETVRVDVGGAFVFWRDDIDQDPAVFVIVAGDSEPAEEIVLPAELTGLDRSLHLDASGAPRGSGLARAPGLSVIGPAGTHTVPLDLHGSWVLAAERIEALGEHEGEVVGTVLMFRSDDRLDDDVRPGDAAVLEVAGQLVTTAWAASRAHEVAGEAESAAAEEAVEEYLADRDGESGIDDDDPVDDYLRRSVDPGDGDDAVDDYLRDRDDEGR